MLRRTTLVFAALLVASTTVHAESMHIVTTGQTLYSIAKKNGCSVKQLEKANSMHGTRIYAGEQIVVPDCASNDDSGKKVKSKKDDSDDDVQAVYGGAAGTKIRAVIGQSVGQPWDGYLKHGVKLPPGKGYYIRRPQRSYGTTVEVMQIQRAIKAVRKRFPHLHTLAIGDLSQKGGGDIGDHHSHETGRDVDIGFYFKKKPADYPESFVSYTDADVDLAATWALVYAFARTHDQPNGVEMIFLDTHMQKKLYDWAKAHGVPEDYLNGVFQYAGGDIVKHEPNHDNHIHVRFKCPEKDSGCEN
jgi:murein endopeptidase